MSLDEFEYQIIKIKINKRNEYPWQCIISWETSSVSLFLIFRCKYFYLRFSSIHTGKQIEGLKFAFKSIVLE